MKTFVGTGILTLAIIVACCSQLTNGQQTADEIKEELKRLLGQEAQIYESKLRLLQQLQSLQPELVNAPITPTTAPPPPPVAVTVTRIVTPVEDESTTLQTINSASAATVPVTPAPTTEPAPGTNPSTVRNVISSTSTSNDNKTRSVGDIVSFSEVRVDSPGIIILNKGRKPALVRSK